jgi:hypothetical protein
MLKPWCWYCEREFEDEKGGYPRHVYMDVADQSPVSSLTTSEVETLQMSDVSEEA